MKISGPNGRYYKVQDVGKLINTITQRGVHSLTKDLSIDFGSASLSERTERVLKVAQAAELQNIAHRYTSYRDKDELYIGWVLDEFFSTFEDGDVLIEERRFP